MVERVVIAAEPTGQTAPEAQTPPADATPASQPQNLEKALADTKAALTQAQQELAALKKPVAGDPPADAPPAAGDPPAEDKPEATPDPQQDAAKEAVEAAGFDVSAYSQEFETTGDVSPENRDKIAEGLKKVLGDAARKVVDDYIEGRKVLARTVEAELYAAGGGKESYPAMLSWAKTALTPQEVAQFDASVSSGDHNAALFAIKGLHSRFVAANGKEPTLINAGAPSVAVGGFASNAELVAAVGDPRYAKDPAYRKQVEERLKKTDYQFKS